MPLEMTQEALDVLVGTGETEMRALFDQLAHLPELDLSLQVPLPAILTPDVDRAVRALRQDDGDEFDRALEKVVPMVDPRPKDRPGPGGLRARPPRIDPVHVIGG
jgi:hypothetical protein